ncbi:unnamed protein product, partial [Ophioblennius macclurei]
MHSDAANFPLNSHLTTLASIHKIHHTLHRLNLTEEVGQDSHPSGETGHVTIGVAVAPTCCRAP